MANPFSCRECGQGYSKWTGRCTLCGSWNSVAAEEEAPQPKGKAAKSFREEVPVSLRELSFSEAQRVESGIREWDLVLGGGLVQGSLVLLGGEPGIGKSTLLLQAANCYAGRSKKVLYVSGEESAAQIKMRAERLKIDSAQILVLAQTHLESIFEECKSLKPDILVLDSVQTLATEEVDSAMGSVSQLRAATDKILQFAKTTGTTVLLVGHVTKEGSLAGPKALEHMVDAVLYFESGQFQDYRVLRTFKNRFGSTQEIGVFRMSSFGMEEVSNPSQIFLSAHPQTSGCTIGVSLEGTRPILLEVQALVTHTPLPTPRRTALGIDPQRVSLLVAILEKRAGYRFYDQDIYVNLTGGMRIQEPASDLSVMASILSSFHDKSIPSNWVFLGELGLGGEIRQVSQVESRMKECARLGMERLFLPKGSVGRKLELGSLHLQELSTVQDLQAIFA